MVVTFESGTEVPSRFTLKWVNLIWGASFLRMDYSPRAAQLRGFLRQLRKDAGLTQAELALLLGKPQTFVSKSELGERRLDFLETLDFCQACGLSPTTVVKRLLDAGILEPNPRRTRQ